MKLITKLLVVFTFGFIFSFNLNAQIIVTIAGGGSNTGEDIPATSALLGDPTGIAVDDSGNVFIAEYNNYRVRKVSASNGLIITIAGGGSVLGDGGPATSAEMSQPTGVAVDHKGNVFIADYQYFRIRKVAHGIITTYGGNGTFGWTGDGGQATSAEIDSPSEICIDTAGNIYFTTDGGYSLVRKITASTGLISTIAGNGTNAFGGDGGPATLASLQDPKGVAVDDSGNVYINDTYDLGFVK